MNTKARHLLPVLLLVACGSNPSPSPADTPSDLTPDGAVETTGETLPPDEGTLDVVADAAIIDPACASRCAPFSECAGGLHEVCIARCGTSEAATCEDACLAEEETCEGAAACLGHAEPALPFPEGPYGTGLRELAAPFELPTTEGTFSSTDTWTGRDSYIFLLTQTGIDYTAQLWKSAVYYWLKDSPPNVHYFFMAYSNKDGVDDAEAHVTGMKARIDPELEKLGVVYGKATECHWRRRIHYVPVSAWSVGGWVQDMLQIQGRLAFAIDRFHKIRNIGLLSLVNGPPLLYHVLFEAQHFDFEWEREEALVKDGVTSVTLFDEEHTKGGAVDVELPSAELLQGMDTLEMDLTSNCVDHDESQCPEWDVGASLSIGEFPVETENTNAEVTCQQHVPAVEASEEVLGACEDGMACSPSSKCADESMCAGYSPAMTESDEVPADTLPCWCVVPGTDDRESTQSCNNEGTGYNLCTCNKTFEITRWITTYSREGRWVSDASEFLTLFANGGKARFHYSAGNKYVTTLKLRFYNQGKADRPAQLHRLFGGGTFNLDYNGKYEPVLVDIPADTTRVEVVARISGHGWGKDNENCAEFCNHTHHFTVDGTEFMHDQAWVGKTYGCASQVADGTVPNQYGTWTIGRAGWCPGLEVAPFVADVTDALTPGETATITYKGLFDGQDYEPISNPNGNNNGFGANIWMESWLVIYQ